MAFVLSNKSDLLETKSFTCYQLHSFKLITFLSLFRLHTQSKIPSKTLRTNWIDWFGPSNFFILLILAQNALLYLLTLLIISNQVLMRVSFKRSVFSQHLAWKKINSISTNIPERVSTKFMSAFEGPIQLINCFKILFSFWLKFRNGYD